MGAGMSHWMVGGTGLDSHSICNRRPSSPGEGRNTARQVLNAEAEAAGPVPSDIFSTSGALRSGLSTRPLRQPTSV